MLSQSLSIRAMSFDVVVKTEEREFLIGLNPFRSGQCLSTIKTELREFRTVSIPFDQGNVFRQKLWICYS